MQAKDVVARVKAIDWFARCGEPFNLDLTMEVERVNTWPQAMKALKSRAWNDAKTEARNQLTIFLARHHRTRYNDTWNPLGSTLKSQVVTPLMTEVWEPFQEKKRLDYSLVSSTLACVYGALFENAYMDCNHGCFFFLELLTVFEAGLFPCGWRGEWPQGKLIVF